VPPFVISPADFGDDPKAISAAQKCLGAIWELAQTGRADLLRQCVCGRYNWRKKSCNPLHRKWKSRQPKPLSR
jgi:hypothetical protein